MLNAQEGDKVSVRYVGKLDDGTVFATADEEPLEFTIGARQMMPGVEAAVLGMQEGDKKQFTVEPAQAFGPRREELVFKEARSALPADAEPQVGMRVMTQASDEQMVALTIIEISDEHIVLDANHPLAGRALHFDMELMKVDRAS